MIVLIVDDAHDKIQRARAGGEDHLVWALANGAAGINVLPLFAGHANVPDELAQCGVPPVDPGRHHTMGRLRNQDIAPVVRKTLRTLTDHDECGAEPWVAEVVERADGWPGALDAHLHALTREAEPAGWKMTQAEFDTAMSRAQHTRYSAYDRQLLGAPISPERYGACFDLFGGAPAHDTAAGLAVTVPDIARHLGMDPRTATGWVRRAQHAGLLAPAPAQDAPDGAGRRYVCPVPGLIAHLGRRARDRDGPPFECR